jgi:3-oxoacyl-[acyl-carrier protein] reductase
VDIDSFFEAVIKEFGYIDILITNAGGPKVGKFESFSDSDWNSAFQQNFMSIVQSIRHILPSMRNRKYGRIVAITSIAVKNPVENLMLSNAIRAGVTGFIKSLSNEVARDGITVNTACPGYTLTDRVFQLAENIAEEKNVDSKNIIKGWNDAIPMGRMASPEEFSSLVMYLCSERAAYVTGTSFWADGGFYSGLM